MPRVLLFWGCQRAFRPLEGRVGACRPSWRRAFVRFSEIEVARNSFLSHIRSGLRKGKREGPRRFWQSVLSETADAGCRLNRDGLHRRVKTDIPAKAGGIGSNLCTGVRAFGLAKSTSVRRTGFRRRPAGPVRAPEGCHTGPKRTAGATRRLLRAANKRVPTWIERKRKPPSSR